MNKKQDSMKNRCDKYICFAYSHKHCKCLNDTNFVDWRGHKRECPFFKLRGTVEIIDD